MEYTQESLRELAERIYDLDAEVYTHLGSSLGRVFNRDRERCVTDLVQLMMQRDSGHQLRSELALISNMARTIPDKESRFKKKNENSPRGKRRESGGAVESA